MVDEAKADDAQLLFEDGGTLSVDMDNVKEAKFENLPKAIFEFEIESCEYKQSANSGNWMWETWCTVINNTDYAGRKLPYYFTFSAKALPFTKAALAKVAPDILAMRPFKPQQIADQGLMLGKRFKARTTLKEYEGQQRSQIGQILANTEGGITPQSNSGSF